MTPLLSISVLSVVTAFLVVLAVGLAIEVRSIRAAGLRVGALRVGVEAPQLRGTDVSTGAVVDVPRQSYEVLLFVSPNCPNCHRLVGTMARTDANQLLSLEVTVICTGDRRQCRVFSLPAASNITLVADPSADLSASYGLSQYPMAVVIENYQVQGYGNPRTFDELRQLCSTVRTSRLPVASASVLPA